MSHTPSPWENDRGWIRATCYFTKDCQPAICSVHPWSTKSGFLGKKESEANARLIAAAPDLLHACEVAETVMMLVEPRSHKAEYLDALAVVRAAIAQTEPSGDQEK